MSASAEDAIAAARHVVEAFPEDSLRNFSCPTKRAALMALRIAVNAHDAADRASRERRGTTKPRSER